MADKLWAITAYFNPMHWRRRCENYRQFRRSLSLPLVAVELGYDGQFDLAPGDAEILIQRSSRDVMWQKERLLNMALAAAPPEVEKVVAVDCDVIFGRPDVWPALSRALDDTPLLQPFSRIYYLPPDHPLDFAVMELTRTPALGFSWLKSNGRTTAELCNPVWSNPGDDPPVSYGLAWAFRRELFADRGLYDAWVVGGGTRAHCFGAAGMWRECAEAMRFTPPMRDHFRAWTEGFHAAVRNEWACLPGPVAHLWHGSIAARKHRQRYVDFARFDFDPAVDLALEGEAWRWNSDKPQMHAYVRDYFAGRREDSEEGTG